MKILVVGSGGREHALGWKIAQSPHCEKICFAPGNPGTMSLGQNVSIEETDIKGLADYASQEKIDLTVVGPEIPLCLGIADEFEKRGLRVFGPKKKAAELEGSKIFAKQFMSRHKIPTGRFWIADTFDQAKKILSSGEFEYPAVVKADGLAGGKGAVICMNAKKAEETASDMMVQKKFGSAGKRILVEEFLRGREVSFIVVSDGARVQPLVTTMDHKAVFDGDKGPNTGGMGAVSPSPYMSEKLYMEVMNTIIFPTVTCMLEEGRKFKGVLYAGIMLTEEGPKVLEYNCRFGDPETQTQMLRFESDIVEVMMAAIDEEILRSRIQWSHKPSGCVVLTSGGYPLKFVKGKVITGLKEAAEIPGIILFHAGMGFKDGQYFTAGGRVLSVCASEETLAETIKKIYDASGKIYFEAMHFRRDIGSERG